MKYNKFIVIVKIVIKITVSCTLLLLTINNIKQLFI